MVSFCAFVCMFYDWETKTVFITYTPTLNELSTTGGSCSKPFGNSPLEIRKIVLW